MKAYDGLPAPLFHVVHSKAVAVEEARATSRRKSRVRKPLSSPWCEEDASHPFDMPRPERLGKAVLAGCGPQKQTA
jgi:hypothetical protein